MFTNTQDVMSSVQCRFFRCFMMFRHLLILTSFILSINMCLDRSECNHIAVNHINYTGVNAQDARCVLVGVGQRCLVTPLMFSVNASMFSLHMKQLHRQTKCVCARLFFSSTAVFSISIA